MDLPDHHQVDIQAMVHTHGDVVRHMQHAVLPVLI